MNTILYKQRNCSIDIFRIIFAILVVLLHSLPQNLNSYPLLNLFLTSIPRFSVPYFFAVSGYFFSKGIKDSNFDASKQIKKIIKIYFAWSCIYSVIKFVVWGHQTLIGFVVDCVYSFFMTGTYYHLWYFPSLIFAILMTSFFYKFGLKKACLPFSFLFYPLCYLFDLINVNSNIIITLQNLNLVITPFSQGLFYFCCGQLINLVFEKYRKQLNAKLLIKMCCYAIIVWFLLVICNFIFEFKLNLIIIFGIYFITGLIILTLLYNPMYQFSSLSQKCKYLANFTYFSHPIFHYILNIVKNNYMDISDYLYFPLTIILTLMVGISLYILNNKSINKFIC